MKICSLSLIALGGSKYHRVASSSDVVAGGVTATASRFLQAPRRNLVALNKIGNNGLPAEVFPLGLCEGDCDNDSECAPGLGCFQRGANEPVRGCDGNDSRSTDYCFDPTGYLHRWGNNGLPVENFPLQACQGDCDRDSECAPGLECFQRNALEAVPGCEGEGRAREDYCFVPTNTPDGYKEPYQGVCEHNNELYNGIKMEGLYTDPLEAPGTCGTYCDALGLGVPGYVGFTTKIADGQCQCHFDDGSLPSPIPEGATEASDRLTVGPVSDGTGQTGYECFAYLSYVATATPSVQPTPPPTRAPAAPTLVVPRPIKLVGNNGLPEGAFPLDACLGDCDTDSDCQPGMFCFSRNADEFKDVPGCTGSNEEANGYDVCFERAPNALWRARNPVYPLGACLGDCNNDADCEPGLYCFQRDADGFVPVPGCVGGDTDDSSTDYCFARPANYVFRTGNGGLNNVGVDDGTFPLGACEGDCDQDSECGEGLKCFSRSAFEEVPGCVGVGTRSGDDICFDHTLSEQPTDSPSQTPTPKPTNSPSKPPSLSPSVSPTTAAPTDAPTLNEVASIFDKESYVSVFGCNNPDANVSPRAVDGSTKKYVCDRTGLQEGTNEAPGMVIIPSHNKVSIAKALRVYSHNDCALCDPITYSLEGRLSSGGSWTLINFGNFPWIDPAPGRNSQGEAIASSYEAGDSTKVFSEVFLGNDVEYLHYKLTFQATRDTNSNSLQFAEVELPGVLYEDSESEFRYTEAFVQALSCPSVGSSKAIGAGTKIVSLADALVFCGIFIHTSSDALIPYARSYNGYDWEAAPGPLAAPESISCSGDTCMITLPNLEDSAASYVILAKDGTSSDNVPNGNSRFLSTPDVRKDIARFLETVTFGTKLSEIEALDNGNWDAAARASYVRAQIDLPKTSHREYFRQRANPVWGITTQEARSDHPCSPNSKWRRYSFLPRDRYDPREGDDFPNVVTFETVSTEQDTSQIYEADSEGDVVAHGGGVFESDRSGFSGSGFYNFGWNHDYLEINIEIAAEGMYPLSFRYSVRGSSYGGNRPCQLFVNQELIEAKYDFKNTDGSNRWMYSELVNVDLISGPNNITIVSIEPAGPDIDHLRLGTPAAVLIKQNGHTRAVAKNGLHVLDEFEYEFAEDTNYIWSTYPYPPLGDLYRYPYGRAIIREVDGNSAELDSGNPPVDWTGYEEHIGNYFEFGESDVFTDTASNLVSPYVGLRGDELLLQGGYDGPICHLVPQFAEQNDAPIFGKMTDGSWVQWTPQVLLESNGPSINTDHQDMTNDVLSDGGAAWSNETGGVLKCSNVDRSFVNEKTCFLSSEACLADGSGMANDVIVCGSLGEVTNDPTSSETYGIETEHMEWYRDGLLENQKTEIWTEIALYKPDQLRQRMAWALSQIVTSVPNNIDGRDSTEIHINFYDIFVRHGLGSYREILREASYSPLMAEHLTYEGSKSTSYVYEDEDKRPTNADENYAREIMQLFTIGLIKLNDDATPVLDPETGNPIETYTNEDIVSFARAWTGFSKLPVRGNFESRRTGSDSNKLDPMMIVPAWRDPFPKTNLQGGFIGDGHMLCTDLPMQPFLKKGATYRLLGSRSSPDLMTDEDELGDDAAHNVSRVELAPPSALYGRLYNGGNYELIVVLEDDLVCTPDTVECQVDTLRVVKAGSVYYEYVERPCVQLGFYDNGKQVQLRYNTYRGAMCANADLSVAREACCREDHYQDVRVAAKELGVTHFYDHERMTYNTAKDRCTNYGKDLCVYETVDQLPNRDRWREHGYHWTNKDCGINVKVNADGYIAIIHDAMTTYTDTVPWLVEEENSVNWFKVHWEGSGYPGSSETNTCVANGCKHMTSGHCLCKTTVTDSVVFTDTANVSKEDVMGQLFLGTYGPRDGSVSTDLENGVTVHIMGNSVDERTVFEVQAKGQTVYLKNVLSTVSLQGWTAVPQIYEAEQAEIFNAEVRDNTASATGGEYVYLNSGVNASTYVEWNNVVVPTDGEYEISLRYAVDYTPRPLSVFVNNQEVKQRPSNPNTPIPVNSITSSTPLPSSLERCDGDCDTDSDCQPGLFCMQNSYLETVPGCSIDVDSDCPLCQKKGYDYCVALEDFDYGFTLTPTGGGTNDWHMSKPLKVNLSAGLHNTIRVQLPQSYTRGPNIDHLVVTGASTPVPSSFRNPPHFMSLMPNYNSDSLGEQTARDAQYETEAVLDDYFYHSNVAPFLCPRVMQRFGFSNPSRRYIASCVQAFRSGHYASGGISFGSGEYGSLEAMAASIILDREATDPAIVHDPAHGNMREPILKVTNLLRSMEYQTSIPTSLDGPLMQTSYGVKLWGIADKIGNGPHTFPSVFGYYLPAYTPTSGAMVATQLVSPETAIITMPNIASTINGLFSLIKYGLGDCNNGFSTNPKFQPGCVDDGQYENSYGHLLYQPANVSLALQAEELSLLLTAGRMTDDNINKIVSACSVEPDSGSQSRCMKQLVVTSGEFHSTSEVVHSGEARSVDEPQATAAAGTAESGSDYKAIVYYNLAGGLDSYNMLAPYSCAPIDVYDNYRKVRGQSDNAEGIGLPLTRLLEIPSNNTEQPCQSFGIHEMLPSLRDLYLDNELTFIANAGLLEAPATVDNYKTTGVGKVRLFAHDGMSLEMKLLDIHDDYVGSGVGGRMLNALTQAGMNVNAFSLSGEDIMLVGIPGEGISPFIVNGDGVSEINEDPSIENMNDVIMEINSASTIESGLFAEQWSSKLSDTFAKTALLKAELDTTSLATTWAAEGSVAEEFKTVTRIMQTAKARGVSRDVFYIRTGGFDTHSEVDPRLVGKFTTMNNAIRDFVAELKELEMWKSTVLVQFSEFGRTLDENSNNGADHAWGGHHFMLGGSVQGGRVLGKYLSEFEPGPDNPLMLTSRGRVIPQYPWDAMWKGTAEWFGVPASGPDMDKVLPMHKNFPSELLYDKKQLFHMLEGNDGETSTS